MGRSVSYPAGAQVAFRILDSAEPEDADWEYETLCDDILSQARASFPSFDPCKGWRGREDRILLRNSYSDIGSRPTVGSPRSGSPNATIPPFTMPTLEQHVLAAPGSGWRRWRPSSMRCSLSSIASAGCRTARRFISDARRLTGTVQMNIRMPYRSCERIARWPRYLLIRAMTRRS